MKNQENDITRFLTDGVCVIVEPSSTFSSSIQSCLHGLGVRGEQILIARKFEDARRLIRESRPRVLVTEYEMTGGLGLALIEEQEKHFGESDRISIIVTKNSSDSAIAEAAEEQVDAYVLKPFSADDFHARLLQVFSQKMNPSKYVQRIREGKQQFDMKDFDRASEEFIAAKGLDEKPTLACFYAGRSFLAKGDGERALAEYREGRRYQPLHYKCLIGEFESLMDAKKYAEAYDLSLVIRKNFPVTSGRLGQFFIAAVFTRHFQDLPHYYQLFQRLENRTPWLIQLTSLAFLTAGRFAMAQKDLPKACEYFDCGVTVTGRDVKFLGMVIDELLAVKAVAQAADFLKKLPAEEVGGADHARLSFKVDRLELPKEQLVERGRRIVMDGMGTPELYEQIVILMAELGKTALAESVINRAVTDHPEMRERLYKLLEEHGLKA